LAIAATYENNIKDYVRAIRAYRDVIRRSDDVSIRIQAQWAIAKIYLERLENPLSAAEEYRLLYREMGKGDRRSPEILMEWAQAMLDAGRPQDAAALFLEFRESFPGHRDSPRALLEEAKALLADRRFDRARGLFQETISKFRDQSGFETLVGEAYYGLGLCLEGGGDLSQAMEAYRQSLAQYPNRKVIELKIEGLMKRQKEKRL
jgi:tetratricopeptide (TPR) repeat protein